MKFSIASKSFGPKQVLGPLTLQLEESSITALMGPSGSGKTTLLRILAGLDRDDRATKQPDFRIGMMFQEPHLLPWKTVAENLSLAGPDDGLMHSLGLGDAAGLYPRQVSLGMARRAAFARAVASKPDLLILDEPFASLDSEWVDVLREKIKRISKDTKIPIILTTHQDADAIALDAQILRLQGSPAHLLHISSHIITSA